MPQMRDMCDLFYYSGCDGNDNQFASLEDCVRTCHPKRTSKPLSKRSLTREQLGQPIFPSLAADNFYTRQEDPFAENTHKKHYGEEDGSKAGNFKHESQGQSYGELFRGKRENQFLEGEMSQKLVSFMKRLITLPEDIGIEYAHAGQKD